MSSKIKIAGIIKESIVDGPGIRLVVFGQGCVHNCLGCHNPETHSFSGGKVIEVMDIFNEVKKNPLLDGITFSGGDPFEQAEGFATLGKLVKDIGLNVMTYTGYTYEEIISGISSRPQWKSLLYTTDILVDGRFELEKKSMLLKFRGSSNQRIIDVNESTKLGKIVLHEKYYD